jgi:hypothetical protein
MTTRLHNLMTPVLTGFKEAGVLRHNNRSGAGSRYILGKLPEEQSSQEDLDRILSVSDAVVLATALFLHNDQDSGLVPVPDELLDGLLEHMPPAEGKIGDKELGQSRAESFERIKRLLHTEGGVAELLAKIPEGDPRHAFLVYLDSQGERVLQLEEALSSYNAWQVTVRERRDRDGAVGVFDVRRVAASLSQFGHADRHDLLAAVAREEAAEPDAPPPTDAEVLAANAKLLASTAAGHNLEFDRKYTRLRLQPLFPLRELTERGVKVPKELSIFDAITLVLSTDERFSDLFAEQPHIAAVALRRGCVAALSPARPAKR